MQSDSVELRQEVESAPAADIRRRGWRREGDKEHGFRYVNAKGEPIRSAAHIQRVENLRIPPAWTDVHISPSFRSDLQATGFDDAGRKQYIYHPEYVARQTERKFQRLGLFVANLPRMRELTSAHIEETEDPVEQRVMATLVRLINEAYFRVGSEEYAKRHRTYGITTLLKRHVKLENGALRFEYRGKKGVQQRHVVADEQLYRVVESLQHLPGTRAFQYIDDHRQVRPASGHELNAYIRSVMAPGLSAKDFRTWAGTLLAAETLADLGPADAEREVKKNITETVKYVAERLGNTPAVARSSYISPVVFERYLEGKTLDGYTRRAERTIRGRQLHYEPEEIALVNMLGLPARRLVQKPQTSPTT